MEDVLGRLHLKKKGSVGISSSEMRAELGACSRPRKHERIVSLWTNSETVKMYLNLVYEYIANDYWQSTQLSLS